MTPRPAGSADAPLLAALHGSVFPESPWASDFWAKSIASPHDAAFLMGEPPRGFALLRLLGPEAEILTIGTTEPGRGDGRALLSRLVITAAASGAESLFLEVSAANSRGVRFYRAAGFAPVGKRPNYYQDGSDAIIMRLGLSARGDIHGPARENLR